MNGQKGIRVLIVEDDYLVSKMVKGLLKETGYIVVGEAMDGLKAIEMTESLRPDVVLMDIEMPDMDGIEATRLICERCPTPVVALTAYETEELVNKASDAGVGAYLVKPPKPREVERAITIAMARFGDMMELRHLNAELQARNEELGAFAHTVAHDLKGPLSIIVGFAEVLREEYSMISEEKHLHYLQKIARSGRKMSNIIDELLVLAGVRQMEVKMGSLDMASIVTGAWQRLAQMVEEYQAEIILPATWPVALGYAPWIEEVWVNYLSNAIKYGGRPPRVELGADHPFTSPLQAGGIEGGTVRFWVRDNGAGIPLENQKQLFTPFVRLNQVHVEGYGLGLSIVRRIVEKLGGQVGVESKVGQGSTFYFTLPAVRS
ncbi:MAG: hybrid sensor histidine kinase/response regulator [Chloroflexi bacterium]|nr:MAG: hybrid sensor histidine kinase/response regulator [Chloroflexota bacterium]